MHGRFSGLYLNIFPGIPCVGLLYMYSTDSTARTQRQYVHNGSTVPGLCHVCTPLSLEGNEHDEFSTSRYARENILCSRHSTILARVDYLRCDIFQKLLLSLSSIDYGAQIGDGYFLEAGTADTFVAQLRR